MVRFNSLAAALTAVVASVSACGDDDSCYGPQTHVMTRHVRRMQPDALSPLSGPRGPLAWGELNFLHTTDTHGWLEGHLKEHNYGADWGDYRSFVRDMRDKAKRYGVDLLVIDTGDLHDGNGLSDATLPDGKTSNSIFETIPMDLLTIGNHELYLTDVAQLTKRQFAAYYGDKYLTSNVKIYNEATGAFEFIGVPYRYFITDYGIRIMSFGVLFNFKGNSNISQVTPAATLINQTWFQQAVNYDQPIDLFLVIGHNPVRPTVSSSTLYIIQSAIRKMRPNIPIQIFGGHQHVRDFSVYDSMSTGLGSGRYCETLGWLAMSGLRGANYTSGRKSIPSYVPTPTMPAVAVVVNGTTTSTISSPSVTASSNLRYFRRYLDWNRATFEYHANGSQVYQIHAPNGSIVSTTWDTAAGLSTTQRISNARLRLNTTFVYGCAPQSWTISASPFGSSTNVFTILGDAYAAVVVNESRAHIPRIIIDNTGNVRFDLVQGPFTVDDGYIVSPFVNTLVYIPMVPYALAQSIVPTLNAGPSIKKRDPLQPRDFDFAAMNLLEADPCDLQGDVHDAHSLSTRSDKAGIFKRQQVVTAGYTTTDDFGNDGDDTIHSAIPHYTQPNVFQANAGFPTNGSMPAAVDVVLVDYIIPNVVAALNSNGGNYTAANVFTYVEGLISNQVLPIYASITSSWHPASGLCPSGDGVQGA